MPGIFPIWRSMLFVPAQIEKFVAKAHTRGADAYILDLEDSVPASRKDVARSMIVADARQVSRSGAAVLVRINQPWTVSQRDLAAVVGRGVRAIVLPKVNCPDYVRAVAQEIDSLEAERDVAAGHTLLIAQIEDVDALARLDEIAASSSRLMGMTLGSEDFSASVGMEPIPAALFAPNQSIVFACRRAGILPFGFPASIADYAEIGDFRATIKLARQLGFVGAFCIHPSQVAVLNEEFAPTPNEIAHARGLVSAYEQALKQGRGAAEYRGKMIDPPVVMRAQELLRRACHLEISGLAKK